MTIDHLCYNIYIAWPCFWNRTDLWTRLCLSPGVSRVSILQPVTWLFSSFPLLPHELFRPHFEYLRPWIVELWSGWTKCDSTDHLPGFAVCCWRGRWMHKTLAEAMSVRLIKSALLPNALYHWKRNNLWILLSYGFLCLLVLPFSTLSVVIIQLHHKNYLGLRKRFISFIC